MTAPINIYHALSSSLVRKGRPNIVAGRPSGTGYVTYESLQTGGLTMRQVLAKVTNGDVLTLPDGVYEFADFNDPISWYAGIRIPTACGGIWGSGRNTILRMTANSSTKASDTTAVPPSSGTIQCKLVEIQHSNCVVRNLQIQGTPQGHAYNGLAAYGNNSGNIITGVLVQDVYFNGAAPGYANFPPGETTSFGTNWTDGAQLINCEIDGRDPATGLRNCASPFGWNNSTNAYVQDVYAHHAKAGMPTFYLTTGVHTVRLRSEFNGSGSGSLSGEGINHEDVSGTVLHESPSILIDRANGNTGLHMSMFNAIADNPNFTVTNPTFDAGPSNGAFAVSMFDNYVDPLGRTQKQVTPPTVTKNGVSLIARNSTTYNLTTVNAATDFVHYH